MRGRTYCQSSPTSHKRSQCPPRATFSKTNSIRIKRPIFATENSVATNNVAHIVRIINNIEPYRGHFARFTTMKIINVVAFEESVLFNVDEKVPAYTADEQSGEMVQTEDTSFSMSYADLARQCYPLNPDIAELRSLRGQHLSGEDWIKLLTGATITVNFDFVKEGDEKDGFTYENTGYVKTIKSLRLSNSVAARLDRALGF